MVRVREDDFRRLRDAQRLLQARGLDSLKGLGIPAPGAEGGNESEDDLNRAAFSAGFVVGAAAVALAAMIQGAVAATAAAGAVRPTHAPPKKQSEGR